MIPTISIFAAGWVLGLLFPWRLTSPLLRALLERARFDLERGWSEAAYDNLGRALSLLTTQPKERAQ